MVTDNGKVHERLEALLREERHVLRAGALRELPRLSDAKAGLIAALVTAAPDGPALERLKAMAAENQSLIVAALEGVRAARDRLDAIRRASTGFDSYDRDGASRPVALPVSGVERRA